MKRTFQEFFDNNPLGFSASIAFYTIFSLPAILLISINIAGQAYQADKVQTELYSEIQNLIGEESANQIERIIENAGQSPDSTLAKVVGIITLIFSATTVFISLQNGINYIWHLKPKPENGIIRFLLNRLLSLAMVASVGFILLVSLTVDALLAVFRNIISERFTWITYYFIDTFNIVFSFSIIVLIFAMIYKVLPDASLKWNDVWVGALFTTSLFLLGKFLIGFYLGKSSVGSAYGAAGSLVVLLTWIYYSSIIILFGAQFTYVFTLEKRGKIKPVREAVTYEIKEIERKS